MGRRKVSCNEGGTMTDAIVEVQIDEADIREHTDHRFARELSGLEAVPSLGGSFESMKERLMEIVPKILAAKVAKMTPAGFGIAEISLTIKVKGNFAVFGIDGDAQV